MANIFAFRSGRSIKGLDPQQIGEALEELRARHGTLTSEIVVEAAQTDPRLKEGFEWDDAAAGHQHRLSQARRLIVSVRVINAPIQTPVPAFVSVRTPDRGRAYVPTAEAMSDEKLRARVLLEIQEFVEAMRRRYAHFKEVGDLLARLHGAATA